ALALSSLIIFWLCTLGVISAKPSVQAHAKNNVLITNGDSVWKVGLNSGNSSFYSIPGSLSQEILHVSTTSNVYFSGRWAFKVDGYDPEFPDFPPTDLFYPYGPALDTIAVKSDDGSSPQISLPASVPVFGNAYSYLYVNHNGLLSFVQPVSQYTPSIPSFGSGNPFLAPFWADVHNGIAGDIYYRQSADPELLARATTDVRTYFDYPDFTAQWVFVATWDKVAHFGSQSNKVNTFQVVLITDRSKTFVLFNYGKIQWTTGTASGGVNGLGGIPALGGVYSGDHTCFYTIPGSLSPEIININSTTNANLPGRWAIKVDAHDPEFTIFAGNSWVNQSSAFPQTSSTTTLPSTPSATAIFSTLSAEPTDVTYVTREFNSTLPAPYPSNSTIPAPYPSNSTIPAPYPSNSTIPAPYPSNSTIPAPYPSISTIPAPYPSNSTIRTPYPSNSTIPAPYPSNSTIPTPYPSNSTIPAPYPSNSTITAPYPSNSTILTSYPSYSTIPAPYLLLGKVLKVSSLVCTIE
uniref:NIDO domain-containing protein n=1 Tax=Leptobrachium leishanense TaxID=445787 RepID=A0A8C5QV24_9ANUR